MAEIDDKVRSQGLSGTGSLACVSLVVITYNEEDNIDKCIESAGGVGEIIVVDSFSSDGTVEIARGLGATVYQRKFTSYADQKNWAMQKASGDWVLVLDADESVSPELHSEIVSELSDPKADGYWFKRQNEFFGKKIRFSGWNRDRVLRLFRRGRGVYPERAVHEKLRLEGKESVMKACLDHRPYRNIDDYIDRMRRYSQGGAVELMKQGRRWFPGIFLNPSARFVRMYFIQLGFLDGMAGFILCSLASINVFFKYAMLRELSSGKRVQDETDE